MKNVKFTFGLLIGIYFLMSSGSAMEGLENCTAPDGADNTMSKTLEQGVVEQVESKAVDQSIVVDEVTAKFENLLQEALTVNSPSIGKRFGVGVARDLAKIVGEILSIVISERMYKNNSAKPYACLPLLLNPIVACLSDGFINTKDQLLIALKNLGKYTATLSPEQRFEFNAKFKEKLNDLSVKVSKQKDGVSIKFVCILSLIIDCLLPHVVTYFYLNDGDISPDLSKIREQFLKLLSNLFKSDKWKKIPCKQAIIISFILTLAVNCQAIYKFFANDPDSEKSKVLAAIQRSLEA